MKSKKSLIQNMSLHQTMSVFLAVVTLLVVNAFTFNNHLLALAENSNQVPEYSQQLKLTADNIKRHTENSSGEYLGDNAQYQIEKKIEQVKDQLNVDKPISEKAKALADVVTGKAKENQH
ncbi:MAG TPA: hypothetical protein V6D15_04990 [Oculatellaceae cyanobacterium]|jgi:hypothetical protein